jgi:hypothetical protein
MPGILAGAGHLIHSREPEIAGPERLKGLRDQKRGDDELLRKNVIPQMGDDAT